jgi:hypothetical protein
MESSNPLAPHSKIPSLRAKTIIASAMSQKLQRKYAEEGMKKSLLTVGVATTLMIAWSIGRVQGQ